MKKMLSIMFASIMVFSLLVGCTPKSEPAPSEKKDDSAEIIDGRFVETRSISVEIYDRSNDGGTTPEDNFYTDFIKEGMLRDHNVEVTFIPVPRWTEVEALNNLLAAGDAPDICVTYSYPTIQTYANMGGVTDIGQLVTKNKNLLPNLWELLGDENIYWDQDPQSGSLFAIEAKLFHNKRINTFVREDWLKQLNIEEPKSMKEFEAMLESFQVNAEQLLGADASKMVPFVLSFDVGWRADHLLTSFVPNDISDEVVYTHGFDDRHFMFPGVKNGVKKLNQWYNKGYIWKDFSLYGAGDKTEDNMLKAGYAGAFIHNWDYPYRDAENGIAANLKAQVGPDAAFIAIEPFENDKGEYKKFMSPPIDRKVFFPLSNKEPLASLLYLDWISTLENRKFLQVGEEGVTHKILEDGSVQILADKGDKIMNAGGNIDYTITINGMDLGDTELNVKSIALSYPGVDKKYIEKAYEITSNNGYIPSNINVGEIMAEEGQGPALKEKRDNLLSQAIVADTAKFDSIFDKGYKDYLNSGGQAIIDERTEAYNKFIK